MPYKSAVQRRKFHAMAKRGEISEATVDEWDAASKGKKLPERPPKHTQGRRHGVRVGAKAKHSGKAKKGKP